MKESILNIKNILKIIISVLIIFSMLKSCARATVNVTQLTEDLNKLVDKGKIGRFPSGTNWDQLTSQGNFVGYYILITGNTGSYSNKLIIGKWLNDINSNIVNYPNQQWWGYYRSGYSYPFNTLSYCFELDSGVSSTQGNLNLNDSNIIYAYTTKNIRTDAITLDAGEEYGQNIINQRFEFTQQGEQVTFQNETMQGLKKENLVIPFNLGNIEERNLYHNFIISISTNGTTLDTLNYYTEYNENSGKNYHQGMLSVTTNNNKTYILLSSPRLNFNQKYTLSIDVYEDTQTHEVYDYNYVFLHENAIISNGVITDYGSGDFSNQDIAISNEQNAENSNNMLQDLYDKAFSISGDFIQSKIEELKLNNNFSGDIEIEKAFIGLLSGDVQDFKIAWNQVATHFTYGNYGEDTSQIIIPSGEVNFSKIERENEEFQEVMSWVRIILGFSFGAMLLRNYWTTLLETLGIGIQPFDSVKEEKAIMTDTIIEDAKGEKTRQVRVTKGNKTYIKKYKMNNYKQIGGE